MRGRKNGSIAITFIFGIAATALGATTLYIGGTPKPWEYRINGCSSLLFGIVLLWWTVSPEDPSPGGFRWTILYKDRNFGIGNETISMTVTVVTAIIAIFTLTHELFK